MFEEKLQKLANGDIKELKISANEFMDFQAALMNFPQRKRVVGKALHGGTIIYSFEN